MPTDDDSYESALSDAHKITWRIDDVIGKDKKLDFSRPLLPEALASTRSLDCLAEREKLLLNQIRGNSYLYLIGFAEEFILPFVLDQARASVHGDPTEVFALTTYAEEEAKHIELFRRFRRAFEGGFATPCGVVGNVAATAKEILAHHPLAVALAILHIEWMTQRHYLGSVKDNAAEALDPLFVSLLRYHWLEEAQHARFDTLVVQRLGSSLSAAEVQKGVDDYLAIVHLLDGILDAQAALDLESLGAAAGRAFSAEESAAILAAARKSYRSAFLVAGMTHPHFVATLERLSSDARDKVAALARSMS